MQESLGRRLMTLAATTALAYGACTTADVVPTTSTASIVATTVASSTVAVATPSTDLTPEQTWQVVADLPFGIANDAVVTATRQGLVVVEPGSVKLIAWDGTATSGEPAPFSLPSDCCGGTTSLAAGATAVYVDEIGTGAWILDATTMAWHETEPRPVTGFPLGSALIGTELHVVTAADRTAAGVSTLIALDLETGEWRDLGTTPEPISVGGVTSDGDRLIVAGTKQGPDNNVIGARFPVAYEYLESIGWTQLPDITIDGQAVSIAWVDGAGLLAWNYDLESALLTDASGWESRGAVPMPFSECYPRSTRMLTGAAGICGGVAYFDGTSEQWRQIPTAPDTWFSATDSTVIGLLDSGGDQTRLAVYPITELDD